MTDEPEEEGGGFNPLEFFEMLRKSASVKAGAIMFGEAQVAYYDTLKSHGMSEQQAYNLLAHTTEQLVRGVFSSLPGIMSVITRTAMIQDALGDSLGGKEVPGSGTPDQ